MLPFWPSDDRARADACVYAAQHSVRHRGSALQANLVVSDDLHARGDGRGRPRADLARLSKTLVFRYRRREIDPCDRDDALTPGSGVQLQPTLLR